MYFWKDSCEIQPAFQEIEEVLLHKLSLINGSKTEEKPGEVTVFRTLLLLMAAQVKTAACESHARKAQLAIFSGKSQL